MSRAGKRIVDLALKNPRIDRYLRERLARSRWDLEHPPGHFYSPQPDISDMESLRLPDPAQVADVGPAIDLNASGQRATLERIASVYSEFDWPEQRRDDRRYYLDNEFFSYGDAIALFGLISTLKPRRIVEVGSGFSSALMLDATTGQPDPKTELTFIEPFAERLRSLFRPGDEARCTVIERRAQDVSPAVFDALGRNDLLFIDSSHVSKAGSDVNHLVFDVLPRLASGVAVHIHDVHWPFEYPSNWIEEGRSWNEAYLIRAFLSFNKAYSITLFNSFAGVVFREFLRERMPLFARNHGGSIWLVRN